MTRPQGYSSRVGDRYGFKKNPRISTFTLPSRKKRTAIVGKGKGHFSGLQDWVELHSAHQKLECMGLQNLSDLPSFHKAVGQQQG